MVCNFFSFSPVLCGQSPPSKSNLQARNGIWHTTAGTGMQFHTCVHTAAADRWNCIIPLHCSVQQHARASFHSDNIYSGIHIICIYVDYRVYGMPCPFCRARYRLVAWMHTQDTTLPRLLDQFCFLRIYVFMIWYRASDIIAYPPLPRRGSRGRLLLYHMSEEFYERRIQRVCLSVSSCLW